MPSDILPIKIVEEILPITFNFSDKLQFGEAINGAGVSVAVISGIDLNPSAMLLGSPTFTATQVTQNITGGIAGVTYCLVFLVTATNSHNYIKEGNLVVMTAADV